MCVQPLGERPTITTCPFGFAFSDVSIFAAWSVAISETRPACHLAANIMSTLTCPRSQRCLGIICSEYSQHPQCPFFFHSHLASFASPPSVVALLQGRNLLPKLDQKVPSIAHDASYSSSVIVVRRIGKKNGRYTRFEPHAETGLLPSCLGGLYIVAFGLKPRFFFSK
jgi:hypothetical protein